MKRVLVAVCVLALVLVASAAFAGMGALDGKTFSIKMKDPTGKEDPDDIVFANGTFDSIACHEYGFGTGPYTTEMKGTNVMFKATTTSEKAGTFDWTGTVHPDGKIDGTATMKGKDGKTTVYNIMGSMKK